MINLGVQSKGICRVPYGWLPCIHRAFLVLASFAALQSRRQHDSVNLVNGNSNENEIGRAHV